MRKLATISITLLVLTLLGLSQTPLFPILKYRLFPHYPKNDSQALKLKNLKDKVIITFDDYGIPHIEANNLSDLVKATGFVQARYRGFQLDLLRKFASGRLSELLGDQPVLDSSTVEIDLAMRGWGFRERAKVDLTKISDKDRLILDSFTDGVNQGLKKYPSIEHDILETTPEPWVYEDTLLVGLLQAWSITHNWGQEAVKLSLALELGFEKAQQIYPLDPLYAYGTIDKEDEQASLPPAVAPELLEYLKELKLSINKDNLQTSLGDIMQLRPAASNAWVVGPKLSASGAPILHNDMHLTHSLPSLIFLQHLKMPGLNISGATMPGLPFMISGFNGKVAWGVTSAVADVVDLVIEKEDPQNKGFALNETKECKIEKQQVTINVKDEETREFTIRKTCNGPVFNDMYPNYFPKGAPIVAIRFRLPRVQESFGHLLNANMANNVYELREALMNIPSPIQNIMSADMDGNIAFFSTGSVPIRKNHRGAFPAPGWLSKYNWHGWMNKDQMPNSFNPEKGYLINANNLARNPFKNLPVFQIDSAPSHRFDRIKSVITGLKNKDQQSLRAIQEDNYLERARKSLPKMLSKISLEKDYSKLELEALDKLQNWDFNSNPDSIQTSLYMGMYKNIIKLTLSERISKSALHAFLKQRYSSNVVDVWLQSDSHPIWEDKKDQIIKAAFKNTVENLNNKFGNISNWNWGKLHFIKPTHAFGKKSILDFFNLEQTPLAGGLDSVWKAHFHLTDDAQAFRVVAGPVYRFSIDLSRPELAGYSTDTGASGWPLSPHYSDQFQNWKSGKLIQIEREPSKLSNSNTIMELLP